MKFNDAWLQDPTVFAINRLAAHSDHEWFTTARDYFTGENSCKLCLDGTWKFHYAKNLQGRIADFESLLVDCHDWDDIKVPGHIQMQGYGTPAYVNTMYPWTGREQLNPGEIPTHENPVGSYVKYFELPESFAGHTIHLTFEGVETAFAVYMNGVFVGYSEDSFTPSHFDVTPYVVCGQNKLAVQVFKYASASWLEDQDFWRFSGIFRSVHLDALPKMHIYDLSVVSDLYESFTKAHVGIDVKYLTQVTGTLVAMLNDESGETVAYKSRDINETSSSLELNLEEDIHLWSAENPYLYELILQLIDEDGEIIETVSQKVGLREFCIVENMMFINGERIVFNGVNRHEFSMLTGRCVDEDLIYEDLCIMKRNNINAVRTSHYPNQSCFYRFCDELGLYVIDETNLETHGTWQISEDVFDMDKVLPDDKENFRNAVLDRARSVYERDKNHTSVLIWSCGNESFGGKTIYEMSEYFREVDPRRLVHYEGVFNDRRYPETSDIESQMYTPADKVAEYLDEHEDKPFILCEYAHAMGTSNGALYKYTDLVDMYPHYQGGFIWDFVDQAILKDGYLHYGGDFGERPSDYDFCGNGIVFADRTLTPKMQEVKYCYQPIDFVFEDDHLNIYNRHLFTNLSEYGFYFELCHDGKVEDVLPFELPCEPLRDVTIPNPFLDDMDDYGEYTVSVYAYLKEETAYAPANHEVAFEQLTFFNGAKEEREVSGYPLRISYDGFNVGAVGENFHVFFNRSGLVDYTYGGTHYLHGKTARPNFFRPSTQNDTANQYGYRYGQWLQASLYQQAEFKGYETDETFSFLKVNYRQHLLQNDDSYVDLSYVVLKDGTVKVNMELHPSKDIIEAPEFSYMMTLPLEFDSVAYYGYGPMENYVDRNLGAKLGIFEYDVDENFTANLMPQECGNRTGVRKATIHDGYGHGLSFESDAFEFSALRYLPMEIENARHIFELPEPYETVVRISKAQMGVAGDNTWGAKTHEEFLLPKGEVISFSFKMKGC